MKKPKHYLTSWCSEVWFPFRKFLGDDFENPFDDQKHPYRYWFWNHCKVFKWYHTRIMDKIVTEFRQSHGLGW
jgi:hypothetical protein